MLVSFSVSNFRSFSSEETFSLVASNRFTRDHEDHLVAIPHSKKKVLKTSVIYGANGAGKSNLFKALKYVKSVALKAKSKDSGTGREVFRLGNYQNIVSTFDMYIISNETLYRYGFSVDDHYVVEEWLSQVEGDRETSIYERITDAEGKPVINASGLDNDGDKIKALATVGGPANQSFLATAFVTLDSTDYGKHIKAVIDWFEDGLNLIEPDQAIAPLGHLISTDEDFKDFASTFIRNSSTGIADLKVYKKEVSREDLESFLPKVIVSRLLDHESNDDSSSRIFDLGDGNEVLLEKSDQNHYYQINIKATHPTSSGVESLFELEQESDGTKRLLNLIPALHKLRNKDAVFFIDEIDRSMHPKLVWKFLEFFLTSCNDGNGQILLTTHESNLLDLDLLRRDEIWFSEKDTEGSTHIYSMSDFPVRKDLEIRKHYLQGRFGAIPFLGNIDRMICKEY